MCAPSAASCEHHEYLSCFPPYLIQFFVQDIAHETTLAEWEVFERLAARVRCLILDVRPSEAPSTLSLLKARWEARQIPLFPNLSVVDWPDSLNDSHRELLQVLCANQTLTSFLIKRGFKYATTVSSADLAVVAHSNPKLSHLHIRADWHPSWCAQLTTFRHLRSIYMYDVDATFYRHLSTLQSLEVLSAYVQKTEHPSSSGMASKTYQGFPSLRRLEMPSATTVPPSTLLSMVTPIASPILTSLVLGVEAASASDVYTCLDSLCRLDVLRSLRKLHLVVESTEDRTPAPAAYAFADMSGALFKLRDLEDVEIRASTGTVSFTDADASQMPAAWPRLTSLSITSFSLVPEAQRTQPPESRPLLSALVALAQALPAMKTLDVEIAGVSDRELARLERHVGSGPPQTALRQITFANSGYRQDLKLCDVERLAQVLHRMFPNVGDLGERYGVEGTTRYVYWGREAMGTDVFRLVARLEARRC